MVIADRIASSLGLLFIEQHSGRDVWPPKEGTPLLEKK
jgi:hypothetical protein